MDVNPIAQQVQDELNGLTSDGKHEDNSWHMKAPIPEMVEVHHEDDPRGEPDFRDNRMLELMEAQQIFVNCLHVFLQNIDPQELANIGGEYLGALISAEHQLGHAHYSYLHGGELNAVLVAQSGLIALQTDVMRNRLRIFG